MVNYYIGRPNVSREPSYVKVNIILVHQRQLLYVLKQVVITTEFCCDTTAHIMLMKLDVMLDAHIRRSNASRETSNSKIKVTICHQHKVLYDSVKDK